MTKKTGQTSCYNSIKINLKTTLKNEVKEEEIETCSSETIRTEETIL